MAHVHELEVAERHRRRVIGRRLMLAFLGAAQQRGATKVFLTTGSGNVAARSLYDTIGGRIADQGDTTNDWWNLERSPQRISAGLSGPQIHSSSTGTNPTPM